MKPYRCRCSPWGGSSLGSEARREARNGPVRPVLRVGGPPAPSLPVYPFQGPQRGLDSPVRRANMFDPTGMARATGVQFAARASAIDPLEHRKEVHGHAILQDRMGHRFCEHTPPELVRQLKRLNELIGDWPVNAKKRDH